jgi:allophanate hydrolase
MNLSIAHLQKAYLTGELTPTSLVKKIAGLIQEVDDNPIWIRALSLDEMLVYASKLEMQSPDTLPLYGIPFAIKDNIDLAGVPTTAACAEYAYVPTESATVVQRLIDAGAIPVGKTNLDQFATGLVGTRSPYGACKNSINADYISGGSSSGSAVSVALGMASFSLGTDTAGSGRVPAAFNNLVGVKPSVGLLSTKGVVPACRTLDCVSIFATNVDDAQAVLNVAQGFDENDDYSRKKSGHGVAEFNADFAFGVPKSDQLAFFGNPEAPRLFADKVRQFERIGGKAVEIDFSAFLKTARLLYEGPWVAERYAAIQEFFETQSEAMLPVTKLIINGAVRYTAADTFKALYKLKALQREAAKTWDLVDVILTPTAGTIYTIAEVEIDPVQTNTNLGYYTNFMNLLDLSALAIPAGFQTNGLPFGVTLCAPAFADQALLNLATRLNSEGNR